MSDKPARKDRTASHMLERHYHEQGKTYLIGIDEAGRGPMAGPLVAGAVCLPLDDLDALVETIKGVKDSKEMTRLQREAADAKIRDVALAYGIGEVRASEMPTIGSMTQVTLLAMRRALKNAIDMLDDVDVPEVLLIDYYKLPEFVGHASVEMQDLPKGENQSLSIAAASVIAKVYRDSLMMDYAQQYPHYGFEKHKGYVTKAHKQALAAHGPSPIHRRNYRPVQQAMNLDAD